MKSWPSPLNPQANNFPSFVTKRQWALPADVDIILCGFRVVISMNLLGSNFPFSIPQLQQLINPYPKTLPSLQTAKQWLCEPETERNLLWTSYGTK